MVAPDATNALDGQPTDAEGINRPPMREVFPESTLNLCPVETAQWRLSSGVRHNSSWS